MFKKVIEGNVRIFGKIIKIKRYEMIRNFERFLTQIFKK